MDYVLLSTEEAGELVDVPSDEIIALVEAGELGGLRIAGHWRIPLKSIAQLLAKDCSATPPGALEELFNDHGRWDRIFAAHPEVTRSGAGGEVFRSGVRACFGRAIVQARSQQAESAEREKDAGPSRPSRVSQSRGNKNP